jgi:hypothetical protein
MLVVINSGTWNGYAADLYYSSGGYWQMNIGREDTKVWTYLAGTTTTPVSISAGDKICFQGVGGNLYSWLYHNSQWTLMVQASDTTYSSVSKSLFLTLSSNASDCIIDDFGGGSYVASTVFPDSWGGNTNQPRIDRPEMVGY